MESVAPPARRAPIGLAGLVALIFLTVSGGPYGLEPAVQAVGGRATLLLLFLVPVVWSLPIAWMVAELAATLPVSGGYYRWVREACGEFWGFQEGWWSWLFTWVDMPLYPALAGELLRQVWPSLTGHSLSNAAVLASVLGFIWTAAVLNWLGARAVAGYAVACTVAVLLPFAGVLAGAWRHPAIAPSPPAMRVGMAAWGLALATAVWNYAGWDNVATFAPQVAAPRRTYPRALFVSLGGIALIYILPVAAGLRLDPNPAHWQNGYFVQLGALAGGPSLALVLAATGMLGAWAQYTGQLLYVLPLPANLAADGYLPRALARNSRRGVAGISLLIVTVIYSLFALAGFERLLVADVLLYSAGLALEFVALLRLRRRRPRLESPFRVPLEGWKLTLFCVPPLAVACVLFVLAVAEDRVFTLLAIGMLASGPLLFFGLKVFRAERPPMSGTLR